VHKEASSERASAQIYRVISCQRVGLAAQKEVSSHSQIMSKMHCAYIRMYTSSGGGDASAAPLLSARGYL
jgi:hypothetical protein